jgi:small subunit ribosomal protein S3
MIEREFINQKTKEFYIRKYIGNKLNRVGVSQIRLKKIPLGEKIIIHTSRPSLIVGSKGANIKDLTRTLKRDFKLENPQIEIVEVKEIFLDAHIVAERIAGSLERFGSARFKGVGHKVMQNVINSGALGVEVIISGKIPGSRAKNWRFYQGYLKKCGDISVEGVRKAKTAALLKSGIIGIKVSIMPPGLKLPDHIEILDELVQLVEEVEEPKKKKATKKKSAKKKTAKKSEESVAEVKADTESEVKVEEPATPAPEAEEKVAEKTKVEEPAEPETTPTEEKTNDTTEKTKTEESTE